VFGTAAALLGVVLDVVLGAVFVVVDSVLLVEALVAEVVVVVPVLPVFAAVVADVAEDAAVEDVSALPLEVAADPEEPPGNS